MEKVMTKIDLTKISLGYNWNQDMSYEEFVEGNDNLDYSNSLEIWDTISQRYITFKYDQ